MKWLTELLFSYSTMFKVSPPPSGESQEIHEYKCAKLLPSTVHGQKRRTKLPFWDIIWMTSDYIHGIEATEAQFFIQNKNLTRKFQVRQTDFLERILKNFE